GAVGVAGREAARVPWLEVHGHGGPEVVRLLLGLFPERGAAAWAWPDFLRAIGGEPSRVEAQILLAHAPTVRTAGILLDQTHGAFGNTVEEIRSLLRAGDTAQAKARFDAAPRYAPVGRPPVAPCGSVLPR